MGEQLSKGPERYRGRRGPTSRVGRRWSSAAQQHPAFQNQPVAMGRHRQPVRPGDQRDGVSPAGSVARGHGLVDDDVQTAWPRGAPTRPIGCAGELGAQPSDRGRSDRRGGVGLEALVGRDGACVGLQGVEHDVRCATGSIAGISAPTAFPAAIVGCPRQR